MLLLQTACAGEPSVEEGYVDVTGGRVWYRIVGERTGATPLLLLHGGPGAASYYLEPLAALADERPVVFYDQLGCGRSETPNDPTLWRLDRFVEELGQIREALDLTEVHLLGHSWGTMLATDYMLTRPKGVTSLILASPSLSIPRWIEDANRLRAGLPLETQEVLRRHEAAGTTESAEYQEATMVFYKRHFSRLDPWPPALLRTFEALAAGPVYGSMWGPSEFKATGTLKDYDRTSRLDELDLPVLLTAGRHDEATPETTEWYQSLVSGSELIIFEDSAHTTMLDEAERYVAVVRGFLTKVENR
jgi:proline-specific peptidase